MLRMFLLLLGLQAAATATADCGAMADETQQFLQGLADQGLLGATFAVHHGACPGDLAYQQAFGYSAPELKVPMTADVAVPVGSNAKFFTAVALWQLAEAGLVDVDAPVVEYMDPSDFNQTEQWCPRLHGSASDSPCVYPTARDLLNMGSGLLDVDNCNYPPDAWQRKYCIPEEDTVLLIGGSPDQGEIGGHGPAEYFAAQGYWNLPLEHMPGGGYKYLNAGFTLASYIIEKVSGLSYGEYLRRNILEPAGLNSTMYDIVYGHNGALDNYFPQFGYRQVVAPVSEAYVKNITATTSRDPAGLTRVPPGEVADLARVQTILGFLPWANGAGAIYATPSDMIQWWHTVLFQPEVLNLTRETVGEMLASTNNHSALAGIPASEVAFAQGVIVKPNSNYSLYGVSGIFYSGGINGVESPFFLAFLDPEAESAEETATVGGVYFAHTELQVPLNSTSCEVESPWGNQGTVKLGEEICEILNRGIRDYVTNRLFAIWGVGSPIDPPA